MPLELVTIPCLSDNYSYLIHDAESGDTAVVDVPDATPILAALASRGWRLNAILLTHHHQDHIDGVAVLRAQTGAMVVGNAADAARLPPLDLALTAGHSFTLAREIVNVIDVPGHTIGHIAFYFPGSGLAFTADSLMAAGCGRLFEGTPVDMWRSLSTLAALPHETLICSGHEYTAANLRFALSIEPENLLLIARVKATSETRAQRIPTVPSRLSEEVATNPFLRAHLPHIKAKLGMPDASDAQSFAELRARKDRF